jgi:predicted RNA-binding protein YlqC (UPF0109 family)
METTKAITEAVTNVVKLIVDNRMTCPSRSSRCPVRWFSATRSLSGDIGKLIGAQGRNARSLRVIVAAIGMGAKLRISLDIPG